MKKVLFVLSFLIVFGYSFAQMKFGTMAGVQYNNLTGLTSYGVSSKGKATPTVGLIAQFHTKKNFSVHSGLQVHNFAYGSSDILAVNGDGNDLGEVDKHSITYIQVPITVNYKILIGDINYFYVGLGTALNAALGEKITTNRIVPFAIVDPYILGSSGLANTYWATNFSLGYQMKKVGFQFDLQNGITSVFKRPVISPKWNSTIVRVGVVYIFK